MDDPSPSVAAPAADRSRQGPSVVNPGGDAAGADAARGRLGPPAAHALVFAAAACSLVYEMCVAGALAQVFGDSVFYYTTTIAGFILSMGIGSFLCARWRAAPWLPLVAAEAALAVLGGGSAAAILIVAAEGSLGVPVLAVAAGLVAAIGVLTGFELPLVLAAAGGDRGAAARLGRLLVADYTGALAGSLVFSFGLLPALDVQGTALAAGVVNAGIALFLVARADLTARRRIGLGLVSAGALAGAAWGLFEHRAMAEEIDRGFYAPSPETTLVANFRTRYQKVVVTLMPPDPALFASAEAAAGDARQPWIGIYLNGYPQAFAPWTADTDPFHHALVHPAMALARRRERVLILGGGDGLPAKEVLKYGDEIREITLVDIDGEWVRFAAGSPLLAAHNGGALSHAKVRRVIDDAFRWVRRARGTFDVILVDFPEGIDFPLARSYSVEFLRDLGRLLADGGVVAYQMDAYGDAAFFCVVRTMIESGYSAVGFRVSSRLAPEAVVLLSRQPVDLTDYEAALARRTFVRPDLTPTRSVLEAFRDPALLRARTEGLRTNTFFHPTFLTYLRARHAESISIGVP